MSDYLFKLIPKDPQYIPNINSQNDSRAFLKLIYDKNKILIKITDNIEFIDCGENFEEIICPNCNHLLDMGWWGQMMSLVYEKHFSEPYIEMPCCKQTCQIYDLQYKWDCGFAKFVIEILNPEEEPSCSQLTELEKIIGCELKLIRAYY